MKVFMRTCIVFQDATATTPLTAPTNDVEYAELEFANEKKIRKKKKKSKRKKEMKDEETEYASIDHVRTLLNSEEAKSRQRKLQKQEEDLGKQQGCSDPLVGTENKEAATATDVDDRGRIVLPDGALESSV